MVKKLLKYEFASYAKTILPMEIILLCMAFFTRIVQLFETKGATFNIFMYSSAILLGIAMVVCIIMTVVVCTIRFYKNLYTAEGYLTLTLPVTHSQHIFAKLITAVCASAISLISVIVAFMIATAGDVFNETVKAAVYIIKHFAKMFKVHFYLYSLEILVGIIVLTAFVYLLFYTCITIGQRAKKNRILAAFGVYFAYYILTQIIGTILIIVFVSIEDTAFFIKIVDWIAAHPYPTVHIVFCFGILIFAALSVACFFITRHIMKNKLNIE